MAGTVIADRLEAASTSQLVIENGVALTPPTIVDVNGVAIGTFCRAWVNFNGVGTIAIRASFNVSSITDNGTGNYTVNFTNALPDANYSPVFGGSAAFGVSTGSSAWFAGLFTSTAGGAPTLKTTTQMQIGTAAGNTAISDAPDINVSIFR